MAVVALIGSGVELVAEVADDCALFIFKGHFGRQLESGVALGTVTLDREGNLAIMTCTT